MKKETKYIRVTNYERYQHYKDRNPPWIKLYNSVMDDYEFTCLTDSLKWHIVACFLLASKHDNKIPADHRWIARQISADTEVDINAMIESGFMEWYDKEKHPDAKRDHERSGKLNAFQKTTDKSATCEPADDLLALCNTTACPETEREAETETETEGDAGANSVRSYDESIDSSSNSQLDDGHVKKKGKASETRKQNAHKREDERRQRHGDEYIVAKLLLKEGEYGVIEGYEYPIFSSEARKMDNDFKGISVESEIKAMERWCKKASNSKRKTLIGVREFIEKWLLGEVRKIAKSEHEGYQQQDLLSIPVKPASMDGIQKDKNYNSGEKLPDWMKD